MITKAIHTVYRKELVREGFRQSAKTTGSANQH